jgi:hypothetical protein
MHLTAHIKSSDLLTRHARANFHMVLVHSQKNQIRKGN